MSKHSDAKDLNALLGGNAHGGGGHDEGEGNWLVSYADMMTLLVGFFVILMSMSTIEAGKLEDVRKAMTIEFGGNYQVPFEDVKKRIEEELEKLGMGKEFFIKTTDDGVEISFMGTVFFHTGSADLKAEALNLLDKLIPVIKSESTDFKIIVEGHTDDMPILPGGVFRDNWELSSVRACRVLKFFENSGFAKARLTAVGYADARPIVANRDAEGNAKAENQSQNRRVVIKLLRFGEPSLGRDDTNKGSDKNSSTRPPDKSPETSTSEAKSSESI